MKNEIFENAAILENAILAQKKILKENFAEKNLPPAEFLELQNAAVAEISESIFLARQSEFLIADLEKLAAEKNPEILKILKNLKNAVEILNSETQKLREKFQISDAEILENLSAVRQIGDGQILEIALPKKSEIANLGEFFTLRFEIADGTKISTKIAIADLPENGIWLFYFGRGTPPQNAEKISAEKFFISAEIVDAKKNSFSMSTEKISGNSIKNLNPDFSENDAKNLEISRLSNFIFDNAQNSGNLKNFIETENLEEKNGAYFKNGKKIFSIRGDLESSFLVFFYIYGENGELEKQVLKDEKFAKLQKNLFEEKDGILTKTIIGKNNQIMSIEQTEANGNYSDKKFDKNGEIVFEENFSKEKDGNCTTEILTQKNSESETKEEKKIFEKNGKTEKIETKFFLDGELENKKIEYFENGKKSKMEFFDENGKKID